MVSIVTGLVALRTLLEFLSWKRAQLKAAYLKPTKKAAADQLQKNARMHRERGDDTMEITITVPTMSVLGNTDRYLRWMEND